MTAAFSNVPAFAEIAYISVPVVFVACLAFGVAAYVLFTMK